MKKLFFPLLMICLLIASSVVAQDEDEGESTFFREDDGILVMAHGGGQGLRPDNTMSAFEHAVEIGVDVLEMDIHSTSDGVMVVIHDDTIDRTTDGSGFIQDFTFEEIQAFDAGYYWTPEGHIQDADEYPFRGQGITIPALEELFQAFPDMRMNIEIKQQEPSIVEPFCEMLREYEMTDKVLMASFHGDVIEDFRETCPEVLTSGYEEEILRFYLLTQTGRGDEYEATAAAFQVPEFQGNLQVITPEFVAAAEAVGVDVHVWTINEVEDLERMIAAGVHGIITDYPDVLMELLGRETE